jgi:hypothetical protein
VRRGETCQSYTPCDHGRVPSLSVRMAPNGKIKIGKENPQLSSIRPAGRLYTHTVTGEWVQSLRRLGRSLGAGRLSFTMAARGTHPKQKCRALRHCVGESATHICEATKGGVWCACGGCAWALFRGCLTHAATFLSRSRRCSATLPSVVQSWSSVLLRLPTKPRWRVGKPESPRLLLHRSWSP